MLTILPVLDWEVFPVYKLVCEACKGVENLWSNRAGPGVRECPNCSKYVSKHYFKVFLHVLPLLCAPQDYWFRD